MLPLKLTIFQNVMNLKCKRFPKQMKTQDSVQKCESKLSGLREDNCREALLTLPQLLCKELDFGQ